MRIGKVQLQMLKSVFGCHIVTTAQKVPSFSSFQTGCEQALRLGATISETRFGLGSILKVLCDSCGFINNIPLGKRHKADEQAKVARCWDVNTKAAAGDHEVLVNLLSSITSQQLRPNLSHTLDLVP